MKLLRENLDQWDFVIAAYAVGLVAIVAVTLWAWIDMRRAERRRDDAKAR
ncbi:heme exporter protein CcmD [Parerythrobacter lacustris]